MIKEIYMFPNGSISAIDEDGKVTYVKENIFVTYLKAMKDQNLITNDTIIHANHTSNPASFWIESEKTND